MKELRRKALFIIDNVLNKGAFLNEELSILQMAEISKRDYNLIVNISTGVIKNKFLLDSIIKFYSKIRIKKIHPIILIILEMGIYQMFFLDRIPEYSIINESVRLSKIFGNKGSKGFVNAILRNISRNKEDIINSDFYLENIKNKDFSEYLSIKYSHPRFYVDMMLKEHDKEFVENLLKANNDIAPFTIRVNSLKIRREDLILDLEALGYEVEETKLSSYGLKIKNPEGIFKESLFKEGYFYIQDEASILVAENAISSGNILDLCAAPGGKSFNLAMLNKDSKILSCDISKKKLSLIEENKNRLAINNIKILKNDATILNQSFINKFDLILVDAPCSGLGLYRRKPEIKYNRGYEDILSLKEIQSKILENASKYIKKDGIIIYSTCTLSKEENEEPVLELIKNKNEFKMLKTRDKEFLRLYPNINNTDGFTICRMKRMV